MKTRKNKLKGSVLFTVVSVMALLIIFMISTLLLSTAANRRSRANYSESQAEYTARAAIESFAQAMNKNAAVAQSIINMNKSEILEPTVVINQTGMGSVGYYDADNNWVEDKIQIEYVDDMYVFNTTSGKWEDQQVLRVLATARVGKEERTVAQYIRKKAPTEPQGVSIKGFQTLGQANIPTGGTMTGAFCVGIDSEEGAFPTVESSNVINWATDITYINSSFIQTGASVNISALKPGTGTIIMGDYTTQNRTNINVDYAYAKDNGAGFQYEDMTQDSIPYMYVDGKMTLTGGGLVFNTGNDTATELRQAAPFNLFVGKLSSDQGFGVSNGSGYPSTDVYLMDTTGVSDLVSGNPTRLYKWSSSVVNKTASHYESFGGNLYCNHSLKLGENFQVEGDLRVVGDLEINANGFGNFSVGGDLVVGGSLIIKGNAKLSDLEAVVGGTVYCGDYVGSFDIGGLKAGYVEKTSIDHPATDVQRTDCFKIDNAKVYYYTYRPADHAVQDPDQSWVTHYYDLNGNEITDYNDSHSATFYYRYNSSYSYDDYINGVEVTLDKLDLDSYVKVLDWEDKSAVNGDGSYYVKVEIKPDEYDDDGNWIDGPHYEGDTFVYTPVYTMTPADDSYYWYDPASASAIPESKTWIHTDAYKTKRAADDSDTGINTLLDKVYYDADGNEVSQSEATNQTASTTVTFQPISAYNKEIYPYEMTREAILGKTDGGKYKIVTSLEEVREAVGYKKNANGEYVLDSNTYYTDVPGGSYSSGTTYKSDFNIIDLSTVNDGDVIISGEAYKGESIGTKIVLKGSMNNNFLYINPNGNEIWVVLDNCSLGNGATIVVAETGTVNFLIRGTVTLNASNSYFGASIVSESLLNNKKNGGVLQIKETDTTNINYYGTVGSVLQPSNNSVFIGSAKCPYTTLAWTATSAGGFNIEYTDAAGNVSTCNEVSWIGNCLFKDMNTGSNDFRLLYIGGTDSTSGGTIENAVLQECWTVMYYDVY